MGSHCCERIPDGIMVAAISEIGNIEGLAHKNQNSSLRDREIVKASGLPDRGTANLFFLFQKCNIHGPVVRAPQVSAGKNVMG